jgi:hypothetical protein
MLTKFATLMVVLDPSGPVAFSSRSVTVNREVCAICGGFVFMEEG